MTAEQDDSRLTDLLQNATEGVDAENIPRVTDALRGFFDDALDVAREAFSGQNRGIPCSRFLCEAADRSISRLAAHIESEKVPFCWVATGGYGRGMLSPGSRVRIMLLHRCSDPDLARQEGERITDLLHKILPRVKVEVLTVEEATTLMADDTLHASDLLETRPVVGEPELHDTFRQAVLEDFLKPGWGRFAEKALEESLSRRDPYTSSPYRTELNLKESAGALRDIGTLQKVADALLKVPELERFWEDLGGNENGILLADERSTLDDALGLILQARNELQFALGPDYDVLEMRAQPAVAGALGYDDQADSPDHAVAEMMHDIFHHTGRVARLLRSVNERFSHIHAVAWTRSAALKRRELEDEFVEVENKIYNASRPPFEPGHDARRMLQAFLLSQRRHIPLSQELLEQIGNHLDLVDDQLRTDRRAAGLFMDLLSGSVGVADRLAWMRDCELLERYIPELKPIVHLVHYGESYDFTLDEHIVEAVRVVDRLAHTREDNELEQREILSRIQDPDLLRLALLLHHAPGGADTAETVAKRMGLPSRAVDKVTFLVNHRDLLSDLARQREFEDEATLQDAAEQIGSPEKLRMLYLLTYADCRAMGRLGWFAWFDARLFELYNMVLSRMEPGVKAVATSEAFRDRLIELASEVDMAERARDFADIVPQRYAIEVSPQEALEHLELLDRLDAAPASMSWSVERHTARLWLCSSDVPARFSQVAGVLTAHGLNILNAHAFSLSDGKVLDRFIVHKKGGPISTQADFWQGVRDTLLASVSGQLDLDELVARRLARDAHEPVSPTRRHVTNIHFDNESSSRFTILDLVTWDRLGLLYSVGKCLSQCGANIAFALISTRLDVAEDVFYLNDEETGEAITSEDRLTEMRAALLEAAGNPPSPE